MSKFEKFKESQKRFANQQEVKGFCNWQQFTEKFLLECWTVVNKSTDKPQLAIIQYWADGNGYEIFWQDEPVTVQPYSKDEILKIADNMRRYGGSFVSLLGDALIKADQENAVKLQYTFSEYFDKYLKW